jgi:hypothetical protein
MFDFLDKLNGGEIIGFASVVGGLLVAIVAVVAMQWRRVRIAEIEASLKQQMLDKGMTAAEIEAVMKASQFPGQCGSVSSTGNEAVDRAALVQRMVDNGYEGADIERVIKAYQVSPQSPEVKAVQNAT